MTHTGDHLGFPASGKKASMAGSAFIIVKDGQIQDGWNYMDIQHLFAQLK
jgi:predicted ester cyclase